MDDCSDEVALRIARFNEDVLLGSLEMIISLLIVALSLIISKKPLRFFGLPMGIETEENRGI